MENSHFTGFILRKMRYTCFISCINYLQFINKNVRMIFMAKKGSFFKVLAIGAAVAGACYYVSKKNQTVPTDMGENSEESSEAKAEERNYVNLDFNTVEQKVKEVVNKVADTATKAAEQVGAMAQQAEEKVVEFFDDRRASQEEAEETEETFNPEEDETEERKTEE